MQITYSVSMWNYEAYTKPDTLEDAVAEVRRSGYGVEMWSSWKSDKNLFAPQSRERLVKLLDGVPSTLHGRVGDLSFDEHKQHIDAAKETGSTLIVVHADSIGVSGDDPKDFGLAKDVVAYAKQCGVGIALENVSPSPLKALVKTLENVPGIGICLDIGHVYHMHDCPLKEYLDRLADSIIHLHLQDLYLDSGTTRAKYDSHRTPGQCDIPQADWQLLFSTLEKVDYRGSAVFEVRPFDPVEIVGQAVRFLKSVTAQ